MGNSNPSPFFGSYISKVTIFNTSAVSVFTLDFTYLYCYFYLESYFSYTNDSRYFSAFHLIYISSAFSCHYNQSCIILFKRLYNIQLYGFNFFLMVSLLIDIQIGFGAVTITDSAVFVLISFCLCSYISVEFLGVGKLER